MTTPWIDAKGIHTFYGSSHILHGIDFTVGQGETIGLMGRNGMGKSTLLKSLMGLVKPRSGNVAVAGRDMTGKPPYEVARLGIAYVPEGRGIFGNLSVVSFYIPSGSSGEVRQGVKEEVMAWLKPILDGWLASGRDYVLCGDWNIVRARNDIRNWTGNQKNSGCLPHERAWLNGMVADDCGDGLTAPPKSGWLDTFRVCRPDAVEYTWWSQRGAARANNVGWRIDYQLVTPSLGPKVRDCAIFPEPRFSDHAPYLVDYNL